MWKLALVGCATLASAVACSTVDLGESPVAPGKCQPSREYFDTVLWPEYLATSDGDSCASAGCHRISNGRSSLRFAIDPVDLDTNYQVATRSSFLRCGNAEASPLLTRPLIGLDAHGGPESFDADSLRYQVFIDWFAAE